MCDRYLNLATLLVHIVFVIRAGSNCFPHARKAVLRTPKGIVVM